MARPRKKYFAADGRDATFVNYLRGVYKTPLSTTGFPGGDKAYLELLKNGDYETIRKVSEQNPDVIRHEIKSLPQKPTPFGKYGMGSPLENKGSHTENLWNNFLVGAKKLGAPEYEPVDEKADWFLPTGKQARDMGLYIDPTGFINEHWKVIQDEIGRYGEEVFSEAKNPRGSGKLVTGGKGVKGNYNRQLTTWDFGNLLEGMRKNNKQEYDKYIRGGLSPMEYDYLKNHIGHKRLQRNDFDSILKDLNVIDSSASGVSKFTKNPYLGNLFMKFMNSRLGMYKSKNTPFITDVEAEARAEGIPEAHIQYYEQTKVGRDIISTIRDINLTHILRNPYLADEDLKELIPVFKNSNINPSVLNVMNEVYNLSEAHLSEGGIGAYLPMEYDTGSYISKATIMNEILNSGKGDLKNFNLELLEGLKSKMPASTYNKIKADLEAGTLDAGAVEYLEKLMAGWNVSRIPMPDGDFLEKITKAYRKKTPKYKVRFEAWFKAARIEFSGGGKSYPVLIDLANRIAEKNYHDLYAVNTEVKVWYKNWGNSDDRIVELIERLEANTGEQADWGLVEDDKVESDIAMMDKWVIERTEYYRNKGYEPSEIEALLKEELKEFEKN